MPRAPLARPLLFLLAFVLLASCSSEPEKQPSVEPEGLFSAKAPAKTLLLAGDSLSISLAEQLSLAVEGQKSWRFAHLGKVSSGLTRPDLLDWPKTLADLVRRERPDAVLIMIGANDDKPVPQKDGPPALFGAPGWDEAYSRAVAEFIDIARSQNPDVPITWIGPPVMGGAPLSQAMRRISAVIAKTCAQKRVRYVETLSLFADETGAFARYAVDDDGDLRSIRTPDGVHLTISGAKMLSGKTLKAIHPEIRLPENPAVREAMRAVDKFRPLPQEEAERMLKETASQAGS